MLRVDLTVLDSHALVGVGRATAYETTIEKNMKTSSRKYRVVDTRSQKPAKGSTRPIYIQVITTEGQYDLLVRYLPLDLAPKYFQYGVDPSRPQRQVIDVLFSRINFPDGDAWTYVRSGKRVHMFDEVDGCIQALRR